MRRLRLRITDSPLPRRIVMPIINSRLVVNRVLRVRQVEDDGRVRPATAAVGELLGEVHGAVEAEAAIVVDIDPVGLEVRRGVDDGNLKRNC